MDIDDFIRWALTLYRFAQSKDIDRGSHGYQVWRDVLAPVYFIGRTSRGEPFLTGDKSGVTKFQLSLRAQCELQSRFVGSLINASTEAFCFLVLKRKIPITTKTFGLMKFQRTIFVILLILSTLVGNHLSKKCEGRKFIFKWSH